MEGQETNRNQGIETQIRKGDNQGVDLRPFAAMGYDSNILKQIRRGKRAGMDLELYAGLGYDGEQLREIRVAREQGIDLEEYLQEGFCAAQLRQIRKGIRSFLDVKIYADTCYNWLQMKELRIGLKNRLDVSVYANPFYTYSQMKELRLGLEEGIDVSSYADLIYSRTDMEQRRRVLTTQSYEETPLRGDIAIVDEGTGLEIRLSDNRLKAYLLLPKEHRKLHLSVDYIVQVLKRNGIVYGIDRERIASAIAGKKFDEYIQVAEGTAPQTGPDGYYEFYFNTEPSRKPKELADGRVDYKNVNIFEEVEKGQTIARYVAPKKGAAGMCVRGMEIPGIRGKERSVLKGTGFLLDEDGITYIAGVPGVIEYRDGRIDIYEVLVIKEDVNTSYGNINFHGCVHIYGNVGPNMDITAEGSIAVEGTVESSTIISRGDVLLKNGMAGGGKGVICAKGNIAGNFFEAATLRAGNNIEAGYLMNSVSDADKKVIMMGRRGSIIGGRTRGVDGIEANNIGNRSQLLTEVETGATQEIMDEIQRIQDEYEKVQSRLLDVVTCMGKIAGADRQSMTYKRLVLQQNLLREQAEKYRKERKRLQQILQTDNKIEVLSRAYAGTKIIINQIVKQLEEDHKMTTFCVEQQRIVSK